MLIWPSTHFGRSRLVHSFSFNVLKAAAAVNSIPRGTQLHSHFIKLGLANELSVQNKLLKIYVKCRNLESARNLFDEMPRRNVVSWNTVICGLVNCGYGGEFKLEGFKGDDFTFSSLLSSCKYKGSGELGKQLHGLLIKQSFDLDILVASSLVNVYAKNDNLYDARKVFDEMPSRNSVSWTTMIVGHGQQEDGKEAVKLFRRMFGEDYYPDELTFASVLSSCGLTSGACELKQVHSCLIKLGFEAFSSINNGLINAYSKCGIISAALQCFRLIAEPDLVTWTSTICGLALCGLEKNAIELFDKMLSYAIRPDKIAFLGVLSACSHGGFVSMGLHYFNLMTNQYQIVPDSEHLTCLIDLLGRAGSLDEAFDLLKSMPAGPDAFRAFIRACRTHGNLRLAKWAMEFASEPNEQVNYSLVSNMYASEGRWSDVARMRKLMKDSCDRKAPGFSWVEIAGYNHLFVSGDRSHPESLDLYAMLGLLLNTMKMDNKSTAL
ncbi:pentatricopeptide repeat-containing protein At2g46050, mitochondrial isoform X2 [Benincasa hispida]|uniref:pentatricopeptide repeat-containing protein At2g46050, mitochondrial isoform X2 n=1 Tax=Benincasa hispida TaxID=102211 RepID=UPI0019008F44|nr:pentatricopeptide repeat-containing protein At2g46050, mitochondrial isoform X2 [Benincasa hispida]